MFIALVLLLSCQLTLLELNMTENKIQNELVMWFSQTYPHLNGRLFMVQNTSYSSVHGSHLKAMGLISGVTDLIFIGVSYFAGIELKAPNSKHKREHIERQIEFRDILLNTGHRSIMTSDIKAAKDYLTMLIMKAEHIADEISFAEIEKVNIQLKSGVKIIKF